MEKAQRVPVLSIAGNDPSGGAGIQADIKTMIMNGVYGMGVVTGLTVQNTKGVTDVMLVTPEFLRKEIDCVFEDIPPKAVKIGMLGSEELAMAVADELDKYKAENVVIDTVFASTGGEPLMKNREIDELKIRLYNRAKVLTPNIPELEILTGYVVKTKEDMEKAVYKLSRECKCSVLGKGGHFTENADDFLCTERESFWFKGNRINNPNTHGSGCTLSSAIASNLALGYNVFKAVERARNYLRSIIEAGLNLGSGIGPMDHGLSPKQL